jgi:quercetin dioxygenase-like cupin family protein
MRAGAPTSGRGALVARDGERTMIMPDPTHARRPPAVATRQLENDRAIVTEWRFAPGAHTGWHRHEYDYIVVPLTTGRLLLDTPHGPATAELAAGQSYARSAGVEHDVINDNASEFAFVEIEIKPS